MDLKNKIIYIVSAVTVVIAMTAMIIIYALLLQPLQAGGTTLSTKSLEEATEAPVVAQTDEGQTLYTRPADGEEYAPEQVVITYGANEDETALFTAIEAAINDASSGAQGGAQVQALTPNSTTQKSALVRLPQDVSIEKASAIMLAIPQVSTAEPNHIAYATQGYSVNDPYAATTYWPIADNGQGKQHAPADTSSFVSTNMHDNGSQWWLASVHAFDAWNTVRTDGQVEVAVLDTGVRATHSDLQNNIDKTNAKSFVSGQNDAINDQNGHGTHVAGIIAAEANNNNMFAGVSYNAKVLPIQVLDKDAKGYISDIAAGLDYVTGLKTSGVLGNLRVVSMSLGAGADTTLHNAVRNATDAGLLCVAAVGNDGDSRLVYPGAYDESVCVGATDSTNGRAWCWQENTITHTKTQFYFSNHNQCVDIAAPGAVILSTYNNSDRGLCWDSGTSMATPIVAGTAALMFAENPSLTVSQAKSVLYDTATDLGTTGRDDFFGHGLVNAAAAVATPGASIITSIVPGDASLTVAFNAPASNGASAINGYKIEYSADATTWTTASNTVASSPYMISGLANGIQYYVRISAGNLMGYGPSTTTESTYAPVAPSAKPGAPSIESVSCGNGSLVVSFGAPQTGEGIDTYKIEYSADATTWTTASNTVASSPYTIYGLANGTAYYVRVSAHNAGGWGAPANSVETYAPSVAPDAPSIESVSPGDSSLAVSFIPPAQDGGAAIDAYCVEYSTNGVSWTNATTNAASSPYTIYGLTNGTAYYVRVCAHNVNGNGPYAATGAATAPIAPRTVPSSPTINNVDVGDSSLVVFFLAPIKSGGAVVDAYEVDYSPDGSTWTTASDNVVSSPYTIDGLTNGTAYYVRARAHNAVGWSQYATSSDAYIPLDVPGAPTINNVVPGNGTLTLYFSSPSQNGGADIDKYRIGYRATDNDTWTYCQSELMLYGAVNITDLANGTAYYVCIAAHNAKGYGPAASTSYTNSAYTPLTVPDAPSIVSVMQQAESLVLCFNPPAFNGGADIDAYMVEYSTDAVTWQACMDIVTQSPYTLNGPVSGASYYVRVFAHNQAGLGAAAQTQSAYQLQDSAQTNVPEPPGITSVVPADNALNVYFQTVQANDAYRIEYSATGRDGDWQEATANAVSSPYAIDGLTNGTAYYVRVRAHNQYGWGQAATTQERYVPSTRPDPPMGISVACGNSLLSVMFTAPAYDGNAAVDKYRIEYSVSLDGPWMSCATEPVSAGAAMNILNLANGTPYYIRVCAHNLNGYGEYATTQDAYTPSTVPGAPIISNVRPGDRHIAVSFSGAELNGGAQIDAYGLEYSVADTNEWHIASITIDPSQGEYAIDGLTNGTAYYIRMAAHNQNGWGDIAKDNVTYTPFTAPTPPTITKVVPGDNSLIVYYTAPENDGGSPIDHYDIEYAEANTLAPGSLTASVDASSIDHISASDLEFARRVVEAVAHSNTAHSLATPLGADEPIWKVAASNIPITDREGSYEITGLTGGVPYLVRLVAYNEGGAFSYNNADVDAGNTPYVPIVPPLGSTPSPPLGEGEQPENQPADVVYDTGTSYYANNNDLRESDDLYDDEVGLYYSHIKRDYDKSSGAGADNDADATGSNANRHLPYMGNGTGDIDVDAMLSDAGLMVYGWAAIVIAASVFIIVGIIVAIKVRYRKRWYTSLTSK